MFLRSLLVSMRNGVLQTSLLVSLRSNCVRASPMTPLWKIFLRYLYKYMSTVAPIQVESKSTKLWVPSHSLFQPYMKYFYKLTTYYMVDYNHSINSDNIRRQVIQYIMSLKRKQRMKLKAYSPEDNIYHLIFNNVLSSDSDLLRYNTHKGCCVLNANAYNYKLRSVIGREDESNVTKWTWFN